MTTDLHTSPQAGDMSRRVANRRAELNLSIDEVARRTGISPGYLQYFEEHSDARMSAGSTILLAVVLKTTPAALCGGVEWRPGRGRSGPHPELQTLTPEQCEAHLNAGGIGRVVFWTDRGPVALPVNFEYSDGTVIISTDLAKAHVLEAQSTIGFEVDRVDDVLSEGWSVLVTGSARRIDDPDEILALASLDLESWAGGARHALVAIGPTEVTGRVIVHPIPPWE
jgi:nitroimidazol reductase NimA-like FMN-containing flavoprotein (pyridoxamine 5'-phosphate oxidase superfamily)